MLRIEINKDLDGSIEASGNGHELVRDCMNAIMAMCETIGSRFGGDHELSVNIMQIIFDRAIDNYGNGESIVTPVKQTTVKTLGELLAEDTE